MATEDVALSNRFTLFQISILGAVTSFRVLQAAVDSVCFRVQNNNNNSKMSTWVQESKLKWYENLAVNVLKCGAIPNHVAFIMDGNRRFANKCGVQKIEGHSKGSVNFKSILKLNAIFIELFLFPVLTS